MIKNWDWLKYELEAVASEITGTDREVKLKHLNGMQVFSHAKHLEDF